MIGTFKNTFSMIYVASAFCFFAALLRDLTVIYFSEDSKLFFEFYYLSGLFSSIAVNYIFLSTTPISKQSIFFLTLFTSLAPLLLYIYTNLPLQVEPFYVSVISLIWVLGAVISKKIFMNGLVFRGRTRDGIASFTLIPLIIGGIDSIKGAILSSLLSLILIFSYNKKNADKKIIPHTKRRLLVFFDILFFSNLAFCNLMIWAWLYNSSYLITISNQELIIRLAVYFFQFVSIGSVVIIHYKKFHLKVFISYGRVLSLIFVSMSWLIVYFKVEWGLIISPILLSLTLLASIMRIPFSDKKNPTPLTGI